jgi:hypothetical protein
MSRSPGERLPPHDLQRRLDENPNDRLRVIQEFFDEREQAGDIEGAAYAQTVRILEIERAIAVKEKENMALEHASPILKLMIILGFVAGIIFALLGVWLVYLGATGDTEVSFFGQTAKSANVGIVAIFIGGVTVVSLGRSVLKTIRGFK